jgi:hypothetical protein
MAWGNEFKPNACYCAQTKEGFLPRFILYESFDLKKPTSSSQSL